MTKQKKEKADPKDEGKSAAALGVVLEDYHADLVARGYDPQNVAIHAAMENILF